MKRWRMRIVMCYSQDGRGNRTATTVGLTVELGSDVEKTVSYHFIVPPGCALRLGFKLLLATLLTLVPEWLVWRLWPVSIAGLGPVESARAGVPGRRRQLSIDNCPARGGRRGLGVAGGLAEAHDDPGGDVKENPLGMRPGDRVGGKGEGELRGWIQTLARLLKERSA